MQIQQFIISTTPDPALRRDFFFGILVILIFLLPVLLIQREMYDGVPLLYAVETGDFSGLRGWLFGQTWYLTYALYWLIAQCSYALGVDYMVLVKTLLVAVYVGHYVHFRGISREVFGLQEKQAHAVGLLACLFPSLQIYATSLGLAIPLFVLLGIWGYRWLHRPGLLYPLLALPLMVAGFQLNSVVALLLGLTMCRIFLAWINGESMSRRDVVVGVVILLSAVAFVLMRKVFTPPSGIYTSYNVIRWPTSAEGIKSAVRALAMFMTWWIIPLLAFTAMSLVLALTGRMKRPNFSLHLTRAQWGLVLAVLLLWACAIAPYVLVGKGPPLFTLTALGSGVTEQAIRAFYAGWPIAPTFSVTSGRHGIVSMLPIALMSYGAAWLACHWFDKPLAWSKPRVVLIALAVASFILPWGGAWSRLQQQHAAIALVHGLKKLPAPPVGVVEIRYQPVSDWLMHQGDANLITQQAWGSWSYIAFVYSIDSYLKEAHWGYNAGFKQLGGMELAWLQKTMPVDNFAGERCISRYVAQLDSPAIVDVLAAGFQPHQVKAAIVTAQGTVCADGQNISNPMPERAATY
jgi:hypothetical protein